jgi:hypothetical protein
MRIWINARQMTRFTVNQAKRLTWLGLHFAAVAPWISQPRARKWNHKEDCQRTTKIRSTDDCHWWRATTQFDLAASYLTQNPTGALLGVIST